MNSFTRVCGLALLALSISACGSPSEDALVAPNGNEAAPGSKLESPNSDPNFYILPSGKDLRTIKVSGHALSFTKGQGKPFGSSQAQTYAILKSETLNKKDHKIQWVFVDLDNEKIIAQSADSNRKVFGASSSKIFVGGTLLDKQNGAISNSQTQLMAEMLVVSSNTAWTNLQAQAGDGIADKGRQANYAFTQRMGYEKTRGFQGYLGNVHGNELTALETTEYLYDIYHNHFPGAETIWKLMHTCRTGATRGLKYIPSSVYVGGKTGTYSGPTENPETGSGTNPDGTDYTVKMRNHVMVFRVGGIQYGLVIFSNDGSDENVAILAGGLIREYTDI